MPLSSQAIYDQWHASRAFFSKTQTVKRGVLQDLDIECLFEDPEAQAYSEYWKAYFQELEIKRSSTHQSIEQTYCKKNPKEREQIVKEISTYFA